MSEKEEGLRGLIEHWAHHNDDHRERFLEAVAEAEELGLDEAAAEMKHAAGKADEVSTHLRKKLLDRSRTPHVFHLPNGVDPELFGSPADPPSIRREARKDRNPVLTYVGVLSERTDFDLIEGVARNWPECRLQLVGPMARRAEQRWQELQRVPNLEWRGLVHHGAIPNILRSSDVLLMPHKESPLTLSMDPLKLYEYLTTGLPIASTPVPPTEDHASLIYLGAGERFSEQVGNALEEILRPDAEGLWHARIEESKKHHWGKRIVQIQSDIDDMLGQGADAGQDAGTRGR